MLKVSLFVGLLHATQRATAEVTVPLPCQGQRMNSPCCSGFDGGNVTNQADYDDDPASVKYIRTSRAAGMRWGVLIVYAWP